MFPSDFKELLFAFNSRNVKYLVIGGYAVIVHSQPRATKDLDVLIGPDIENAKAAYAALADFGAPLEGLAPADPWTSWMLTPSARRKNSCTRRRFKKIRSSQS